MAEWKISKTDGFCEGSKRELRVGEEYFAALVETDEGLQRRNFCEEYWEEQKPAVFCYWKTKMTDANEQKKFFIDDDMLIAFFERLEKESEPEKVNFRFVIALILMRKRRLKYEGSDVVEGSEVWHLRPSGEKNAVDVVNPHLGEAQIEQLSSQLGQILQVELEE